MGLKIQDQSFMKKYFFLFPPASVILLVSSNLCLHPGYQLQGEKRFCHIVIRTQSQAVNLVNFRSLGCKHDNGIGILLPDKSAQFQAVYLRHHDIQDRQIHFLPSGTFQDLAGIIEFINLKSFVFQIQSHQICNFFLVIHH